MARARHRFARTLILLSGVPVVRPIALPVRQSLVRIALFTIASSLLSQLLNRRREANAFSEVWRSVYVRLSWLLAYIFFILKPSDIMYTVFFHFSCWTPKKLKRWPRRFTRCTLFPKPVRGSAVSRIEKQNIQYYCPLQIRGSKICFP